MESLFEAFRHKERNRAIQNATWILANLFPKGTDGRERVERFLVDCLCNGNLYRGNKNYITEALLDLNYRRHVYTIRRQFILRLDELEDRVTPANLAREEPAEVSRPCIYDVKKVRPIGREVRPDEVRRLRDAYLSGEGSIDCRRCLAFELLRLHPWDGEFVRAVVLNLNDEQDQTNAYYVVKYLRNWGREEHPDIYDAEVLRAVEKAAARWPRNRYLQQSVDAIAVALK
jgi:hypothetical protein